MSQGPEESSENDGRNNEMDQSTSQLSALEDARSKFLGGFSSLKSEISQLKQTILDE